MRNEEAKIQGAIIQALQVKGIYAHSIPNELAGGGTHAKARMARAKMMGLRAGVADLLVWWPKGLGYMEVKTGSGKQSEAQKKFEERCQAAGIPYHLVRSVKDVLDLVDVMS